MIFALVFVSLIFLACLGATIYGPKQAEKKPPGNNILFFENLYLGSLLGGDQEVARIRALRANTRRYRRIMAWLVRIIGLIFTMMSAVFLTIIISSILYPIFPTAGQIGSFLISHVQYIALTIFVVLGLLMVFWGWLWVKIWISKDNAPIRVHNFTNTTLKISIRGLPIGETTPGAVLNNRRVLSVYEKYPIEAKDLAGYTAYSADLNLDDLDNIDWNVDIR